MGKCSECGAAKYQQTEKTSRWEPNLKMKKMLTFNVLIIFLIIYVLHSQISECLSMSAHVFSCQLAEHLRVSTSLWDQEGAQPWQLLAAGKVCTGQFNVFHRIPGIWREHRPHHLTMMSPYQVSLSKPSCVWLFWWLLDFRRRRLVDLKVTRWRNNWQLNQLKTLWRQWMLAQPRSSQGTDAPGLLSPNQIAQHTDDTLQRNGTNVIKEAANATGARLLGTHKQQTHKSYKCQSKNDKRTEEIT